MSKLAKYVQSAYDEMLHKVSWPSWDELQQTTVIVLVALALVTAIVTGIDAGSKAVLTFIYSLIR